MGKEILRHAYAVVTYGGPVERVALTVVGQFLYVHLHLSPFLCIFIGVGQDVDIDLLQLDGVAVDVVVLNILGDGEVDFLLLHHLHKDRIERVLELSRVPDIILYPYRTLLDASHLQHVVDDAQQHRAGRLNLPEVVLPSPRVLLMLSQQVREPDDGIHGRTYVMAHVEEETRLGCIGCLCRLLGFTQFCLLCFQQMLVVLLLADVKDYASGTYGNPIGCTQYLCIVVNPQVAILRPDAVFEVEVRPINAGLHDFRLCTFPSLLVIRMNLMLPALLGLLEFLPGVKPQQFAERGRVSNLFDSSVLEFDGPLARFAEFSFVHVSVTVEFCETMR